MKSVQETERWQNLMVYLDKAASGDLKVQKDVTIEEIEIRHQQELEELESKYNRELETMYANIYQDYGKDVLNAAQRMIKDFTKDFLSEYIDQILNQDLPKKIDDIIMKKLDERFPS